MKPNVLFIVWYDIQTLRSLSWRKTTRFFAVHLSMILVKLPIDHVVTLLNISLFYFLDLHSETKNLCFDFKFVLFLIRTIMLILHNNLNFLLLWLQCKTWLVFLISFGFWFLGVLENKNYVPSRRVVRAWGQPWQSWYRRLSARASLPCCSCDGGSWSARWIVSLHRHFRSPCLSTPPVRRQKRKDTTGTWR